MLACSLKDNVSEPARPCPLQSVKVGVHSKWLIHRSCNLVTDFSQCRMSGCSCKYPLQNLQSQRVRALSSGMHNISGRKQPLFISSFH